MKETDAYLRWELASGDVWQHVKGFFNDLIGEKSFARTACGGRFILFIGNLLKEIYGYENYECKSSYCCFKSTFQ